MHGIDIPILPPDSGSELGKALEALDAQLRLGIGLRASRSLRLMTLAGRKALHLQFAHDAGWGVVTAHAFTLVRERPAAFGKPLTRPFAALLSDGPLLAALARSGNVERSSTGASRLVRALWGGDRQTFRQLAEWAPLIEAALYAIGARFAVVLDEMRNAVRRACIADVSHAVEPVLAYQELVRALERAILISTDAGSAWLGGLASHVSWSNWTPSFPLTRERTLLGALIGARAASRFGPGVIDGYFDALARARHPVKALDALLGLAAIGIRHPSERNTILARLGKEPICSSGAVMEAADIVAHAHEQARRLLREGGSASPLLSANWRQDAFDADTTGHMRVFRMLPAAIDCPSWKFLPAAREPPPLSSNLATEIFVRAWGLDEAGHGSDPPISGKA